MDAKQKKILTGVASLIILAWLISPLLFSSREPALPLSREPPAFDASKAFQATEKFVTQNPRRLLGSLESRQSTGFLHDRLQELGYQVDYSHFDARIGRRKEAGRNILAYRQGMHPEILALAAHFDTARTTVQGAMKNGAAVGVLLEMARVLAAKPTRRSLLLILSDGGEWGMAGAQDIAVNYPQRDRIAAVLSLDYVAAGDLAAFSLEESGQLKGYSPPWLRTLARHAAESQGLPVLEPSGFRENFERALLISKADQGPFLRAGIPAINLGSRSADRARERALYHTGQDTIENLKSGSIQKYGEVAETIMKSMDESPSIPRESMESLRLWDSLFLAPRAIGAFHWLSFLPLPLVFFFLWINHLKRLSLILIARELLAALGTAVPFLIVYFSIGLFRAARRLPLYNLYPATARDPVLENPSWGILGGILGTALFVAVLCYVVAKLSFRNLPKPDFHVSKLALMGLLIFTAALALAHNAYWAFSFLVLPAWIWALVGWSGQIKGRVVNWILILAAGIPCYAVLSALASGLFLKWNFVWYHVLALHTGLFTPAGYFLAAAATAIGLRFMAIQNHGAGT